jgi:hypothetical protein
MIYVLIWIVVMMTDDGSSVSVATHSQEFLGLEAYVSAKADFVKKKPVLSVLNKFDVIAECYEKGAGPVQPPTTQP